MTRYNKTVRKIVWLLSAILLAACSSTNVASFPIPLGAATGQHTFILFYIDN